tara:strand:+ start:1477 stop:2595 length:1119 start_codon:yes stop_codon:yes gene_type:complete
MSATQLLRDLIAIPSVNPDGEPGTDQTGEKACGEFVGEFLRSCGAEVTFDEVLPDRANVIGRFPCDSDATETLLFGPHLDTVGIAGMTIDPFGAKFRDGKIWGRGASDTKGSMAAMLWALHEKRDQLPKLGTRILFVGFMSEESSQYGSRDFGKRYGDEVDFAVVGEPTKLDVVYAHKACWWLELATRGKAAHSSRPELGDNAVIKMAHVLQAIETGFRPSLAEFADDVLGLPTVSANMFHGGTRANIVPDSCTATIDIRATPSLYQRGVVETMREFLDRSGFPEVEIKVVGKSPTLRTDPENPYVKKLQSCGSKLVDAPWFCDGGWLAEAGIPSIAIGPGSIDQAHTKDEWITVEDLEAGARYFERFLETL